MSVLLIVVCMTIFKALVAAPVSFIVVINIVRNFLSVAFKPSKTYFAFTGDQTPLWITMFYPWDIIDNKYNAVAHMYCSSYTYILSLVVLFFHIKTFMFYKSSIICLLSADVGSESCLLSSHKNVQITAWCDTVSDVNDELDLF